MRDGYDGDRTSFDLSSFDRPVTTNRAFFYIGIRQREVLGDRAGDRHRFCDGLEADRAGFYQISPEGSELYL